MENISYGKIVLIGAGHVGSAILDSLLRMNLADEIVVINRNQKKALGVVLDASHTTAFAYSANANIRVGTYEDCKDAQIIINTAGPSIQPGPRPALLCEALPTTKHSPIPVLVYLLSIWSALLPWPPGSCTKRKTCKHL